jgi:hypothetical protein
VPRGGGADLINPPKLIPNQTEEKEMKYSDLLSLLQTWDAESLDGDVTAFDEKSNTTHFLDAQEYLEAGPKGMRVFELVVVESDQHAPLPVVSSMVECVECGDYFNMDVTPKRPVCCRHQHE